MRRGGLCVAVVVLAAISGPAAASTHPKVTRAQAIKRFRGMLGARPERVHLVWADERLTDVDLEWTAYAPHARLHVIGGPVGGPPPRPYVGPAIAWFNADGPAPIGVSSVVRRRRAHRYAVPGRSYSISLTLVRKLRKENLRIRLTPLRIHPTVSRKRALGLLRSGQLEPHRIWLVAARRHLVWLAAVQRGRYALLDAKSGKLVAVTASR